MELIQHGYRGFALILNLNWDRLLYIGTIALALTTGAYLGAMIG